MNAIFAKLSRRIIRYQLTRITPDRLIQLSKKKLIRAFRRAALSSPAYQILLQENAVLSNAINTVDDFVQRCPILEKSNTFRRFPINQLIATDVDKSQLASILTSSGHGSNGFAIGLSTRTQLKSTASLIDMGLELAFDIDSHKTLLINCLPMGVTFQSNTVCVANVSVREDMACAIVEQAGASFEQIILCGDPIFLKKLCDFSIKKGIDWRSYRINLIVGEETFSESFRDYVAAILNVDIDSQNAGLIGSSMGVGELGLNLFNETRETIALRRACMRQPDLLIDLFGENAASAPIPSFLVFNPLRTFVEVINADEYGNGDLLVTMLDTDIPIPLMRYKTGDRAKLISVAELTKIRQKLKNNVVPPSLPVIALHGRAKDYLPNGMHLDHFKQALYADTAIAAHISGAFRLSLVDEGLLWEVQLQFGNDISAQTISSSLQKTLAPTKIKINTTCYSYSDFPYGKVLDYERKFVYWPG
ncbi:hypothetical protein LPB67_10225 [Undibacterium sp. Jales W-56]|uniref:hypothetical protein n=1 Tax=Undibacterium sp. Jales W-56 TaxID=2897325 RepID=UPI0021D1A8C1|nr:hypothetical protein [Undibacterium sp. Jales W-56]MCU6434144.1 hypothetical protein [Undibacterium sp. Jales W-56]